MFCIIFDVVDVDEKVDYMFKLLGLSSILVVFFIIMLGMLF